MDPEAQDLIEPILQSLRDSKRECPTGLSSPQLIMRLAAKGFAPVDLDLLYDALAVLAQDRQVYHKQGTREWRLNPKTELERTTEMSPAAPAKDLLKPALQALQDQPERALSLPDVVGRLIRKGVKIDDPRKVEAALDALVEMRAVACLQGKRWQALPAGTLQEAHDKVKAKTDPPPTPLQVNILFAGQDEKYLGTPPKGEPVKSVLLAFDNKLSLVCPVDLSVVSQGTRKMTLQAVKEFVDLLVANDVAMTTNGNYDSLKKAVKKA